MKNKHVQQQQQQQLQLSQQQQQQFFLVKEEQEFNQHPDFVFNHPFTMTVLRPTSCGKTFFMKNMLQRVRKMCHVHKELSGCTTDGSHCMEKYRKQSFHKLTFFRGIPVDLESDTFSDPNNKNMIILEDLMSTSATDS